MCILEGFVPYNDLKCCTCIPLIKTYHNISTTNTYKLEGKKFKLLNKMNKK